MEMIVFRIYWDYIIKIIATFLFYFLKMKLLRKTLNYIWGETLWLELYFYWAAYSGLSENMETYVNSLCVCVCVCVCVCYKPHDWHCSKGPQIRGQSNCSHRCPEQDN